MIEACSGVKLQGIHKLGRVFDPWCLSSIVLFSIYYILRFYEPNRNYLQFKYVIPAISILLAISFCVYLVFCLFNSSVYCAALSSLILVLCLSSFSFLHAFILERVSSALWRPLHAVATSDVCQIIAGVAILVATVWKSIPKFHTHIISSISILAISCLVTWLFLFGDLSRSLQHLLNSEIISAFLCVVISIILIIILHYFQTLSKFSKQLVQLFAAILFAMSITVIIQLLTSSSHTSIPEKSADKKLNTAASETNEMSPDIVYILLDGLGREDSLKKSGVNISKFSKDLKSMGFFVPTRSMSSYMATDITLAGVLNIDFVSNLGITSREQSRGFIKNNILLNLFRFHNYRTFSMSLFYYAKDIGASVAICKQDTRRGEFISGLLNQTVYLAFRPIIARQYQQWYSIEDFDQFYTFTNEAIQSLHDERYFGAKQPTFLFIHILYAHVPLVFHADGTFRSPEGGGTIEGERSTPMANRVSALQGQLDYLNQALTAAIRNCLTHRRQGRPIVFFLQGDHGPHCLDDEGKRTAFAAYYWPDKDYSLFKHDMTPVQASRVLARKLFIPDLNTEVSDDPSPSPEICLYCPKH